MTANTIKAMALLNLASAAVQLGLSLYAAFRGGAWAALSLVCGILGVGSVWAAIRLCLEEVDAD